MFFSIHQAIHLNFFYFDNEKKNQKAAIHRNPIVESVKTLRASTDYGLRPSPLCRSGNGGSVNL